MGKLCRALLTFTVASVSQVVVLFDGPMPAAFPIDQVKTCVGVLTVQRYVSRKRSSSFCAAYCGNVFNALCFRLPVNIMASNSFPANRAIAGEHKGPE